MKERRPRRILAVWEEILVALLKAEPAELNQTQIRELADLDPNSVIRGTIQLERLGLVKTRFDGISRLYKLTPRGREVAEHVKKIKEVVGVSEFSESSD
jgi:DNA-binding MarR family transcriptional regulator